MKRSKHSLSHSRLASLKMAQLYPVGLLEVLPGDSFRHQASALIRVAPIVAPVMHPVHLMIHSWFVPSRLLWDNWEDFITGKNAALTVPVVDVNSTDTAMWPLVQAMGVGVDSRVTDISLNALPFRAYNMIYNEFYRDQDLSAAATENKGNTGDDPTQYSMRSVSWEKDYFTTARPQPQQGSQETITVGMTGTLPVHGIGILESDRAFNQPNISVRESSGVNLSYPNAAQTATAAKMYVQGSAATGGQPNINVNLADGAGNITFDINQWRTSMAMQRMKEHRNRYGSRYRDLLAFLGVNSSDARLQRPEYLGGGKQTIAFSEVLSTADAGTANVGDMAGHGIAAMRTRPYKRFFEEHGYVITFLIARPRTVYLNRVPRHWLRRDYEQYWQKELEIQGDQAITNTEVYGDTATPTTVFGYIPRYDEYRHEESSVSGEFRTILDYWHMARKFASQPALNETFIKCDPTTRIYGSAANDQLYAQIAHRISARRLVSKFSRN